MCRQQRYLEDGGLGRGGKRRTDTYTSEVVVVVLLVEATSPGCKAKLPSLVKEERER